MYAPASNIIGFTLAAIFCITSSVLVKHFPNLIDSHLAENLSNTLLSTFTVILGLLLGMLMEQSLAAKNRTESIKKIKTLLVSELFNNLCGLASAKKSMDEAIGAALAGGSLPRTNDMTLEMPRPMLFTENLGSDLLLLNRKQIDALSIFRSSLELTKTLMTSVTTGRMPFCLGTAKIILSSVKHNMLLLAQVFEEVAPEHILHFPPEEPESTVCYLGRLGNKSSKC